MVYQLLHVDDDRRQTELLKLLLKSKDYTVVSANDAKTAFDMVRLQPPDVCLIDINMPHVNGIELAAQIKADPLVKHIPLIALTANTMYGDREYYLSHNFDGYLGKPMLRIELLHTLGAMLNKPQTG